MNKLSTKNSSSFAFLTSYFNILFMADQKILLVVIFEVSFGDAK